MALLHMKPMVNRLWYPPEMLNSADLFEATGQQLFIVDCLKSETSETEIIEKMSEKYDAPKEIIAMDVKKILDTLRSIGAIDA